MKARERLFYWVGGGVLAGIIIGMCISPLTAQDGKIGEITCTSLKVLNNDGKTMVELGSNFSGGTVKLLSRDGMLRVILADGVRVMNLDGTQVAELSTDPKGGRLDVSGNSYDDGSATIAIDDHGGIVEVWGQSKMSMVDTEDISEQITRSRISVRPEDLNPRASMVVDENGNGAFGKYTKGKWKWIK